MDKLFFEAGKKETLHTENISSGNSSAVILALFLLCVSLFFFNLSFSLKQEESESVSRLEGALLVLADSLEENEAVCAFLGIENEALSEDEIY